MVAFVASDGAQSALAATFDRTVVGSESNVAVGLARLGHSATFVGRVGDDPEGAAVIRALRADGVDVAHVRVDPGAPTGILIRDRVLDRPVQVSYRRAGSAGSRLERADLPDIEPAVVHVTGLTAMLSDDAAATVRELAERGRRAGALVTFDPNVRLRLGDPARWRTVVDDLVGLADDVLVGRDELDVLGLTVAELRDRVPGAVVVKDGRRGATAYLGGDEIHLPVRAVHAVDPVGAGDAFSAGWISAFLDGEDLTGRLTRASVLASCVVAHPGDTAGYPDRGTLTRILAHSPDVIR